jgi:hypothetical protein
MLQNIAPELFQRREEVIDANQALVSAYAKTRLRGAKSLSDLELEWLIETGRLELPKGPIWNPKEWRKAQTGATTDQEDIDWQHRRYTFGLFSPLQWLTDANPGRIPGENKADIMGAQYAYNPTTMPYPSPVWENEWAAPPYPSAGINTGVRKGPKEIGNKLQAYTNVSARGTQNAFESTNKRA